MRALGALKMSVGTSLALEKDAFMDVQVSQSFLVNLRTLTRNAIDSFPKEDDPSANDIYKAVKEDLTELVKWLDESTINNVIDFIVYYPSYKSLPSIFNKADLVTEKLMTDKIRKKYQLTNKVCNKLAEEYPKQIIKTDTKLPSFSGKGLIVTHYPVDLVMTSSTTRLKLLESYTGTVKPYTKWYTKLTGGTQLYNIPLNKLTIQIYGDKANHFYSSKMALKDMMTEYAIRWKWTSGTSYSKVRSDINNLPSSIEKTGFKMLF